MVIWKYPVEPESGLIPIRGKPLHIGLDPSSRKPAIWCLVDPDNLGEPKWAPFVIVMTGQRLPKDAGRYVTTITGIDGWIVAHFFEKVDDAE